MREKLDSAKAVISYAKQYPDKFPSLARRLEGLNKADQVKMIKRYPEFSSKHTPAWLRKTAGEDLAAESTKSTRNTASKDASGNSKAKTTSVGRIRIKGSQTGNKGKMYSGSSREKNSKGLDRRVGIQESSHSKGKEISESSKKRTHTVKKRGKFFSTSTSTDMAKTPEGHRLRGQTHKRMRVPFTKATVKVPFTTKKMDTQISKKVYTNTMAKAKNKIDSHNNKI